MAKKKTRIGIPRDIAARIQFASDRTCCVCRVPGKPIQVHHVDDDPSNNALANLAVLCFDCHNDTQISGGFSRKLDPDQVILFRDDWLQIVAGGRATSASDTASRSSDETQLELTTSLVEIYREREAYFELALLYDSIDNSELRDKYVELALKQSDDDLRAFYLRAHVQQRPNLLPAEVIERVLALRDSPHDYEQRARALVDLGRHVEAARDYLKGILGSLDEDNIFSAAYYLKELANSGLYEELFQAALRRATDEGELWWQIRALQELGWTDELRNRLVHNASEIESSGNPALRSLLSWAQGDRNGYIKWRKAEARWEAEGRLSLSEYNSPVDRVYFIVSSKEGLASLSVDHPSMRQSLVLPVFPDEAVTEALPLLEPMFAHYVSQWKRIMVPDPSQRDARGFWVPAENLPGRIADPRAKAVLDEIATRHLSDAEREFFAGMLPVPALGIDTDPELVGMSNSAEICEEPVAYGVVAPL